MYSERILHAHNGNYAEPVTTTSHAAILNILISPKIMFILNSKRRIININFLHINNLSTKLSGPIFKRSIIYESVLDLAGTGGRFLIFFVVFLIIPEKTGKMYGNKYKVSYYFFDQIIFNSSDYNNLTINNSLKNKFVCVIVLLNL